MDVTGSNPVWGSMGIIQDEINQTVDTWFEDAEDPEMIFDAFMTALEYHNPDRVGQED